MKSFMLKMVLCASALLAACGESQGDSLQEGFDADFHNSYVRQCKSVAVLQGVLLESAKPICECTGSKIGKGKTKQQVDAMSEDATMQVLNSCIDEFKSAEETKP